MLAVDCESTGLDIHHEARPFFITTFSPEDGLVNYEWAVDPLTRKVKVNRKDAEEIRDRILAADSLVLQNAKFDVHALASVGILRDTWPWEKTHDTLMAGHLIHSGEPHNLTDMARRYCRFDIQPLEDALEDACKKARNWARVHRKDWKIARDDDPGLPSMGGASRKDRGAEENKGWKADSWLPRRLAREQKLAPDHPWRTVLEEYASEDSQATWMLFQAQRRILEARGQWGMYLDRMKLPQIAYGMERRGITLKRSAWESSVKEFTQASEREKAVCEGIAAKYDYDLKVPKGGTSNHSLSHFCFGRPIYSTKTVLVGKKQKPKEVKDEQIGTEQFLNLPVVELTEKGAPSLRASAIDTYRATLDGDSDQYRFVSALGAKRKRDTALSYLKGYARFWLPWKQPINSEKQNDTDHALADDWFVLHPSLNPTGTATLRWSSSNPNEQNASKKEDFNLRKVFCPAPGREWWSLDAKNIELRIPFYESGEETMIALFEEPDRPPFFGSNHLVNFSVVYPDIWDDAIRRFGPDKAGEFVKSKDGYKSTWYQWCKNGGFAIQYGCLEAKADATFRRKGAFKLLKQSFVKLTALNDHWVNYARKYGYVETMPILSKGRKNGYPLYVDRSEFDQIVPTQPLNYHVQGTACEWMCSAMVRCQERLDEWNKGLSPKEVRDRGYHMTMQVHDELIFDFPKKADPRANPKRSNLGKIRIMQQLMEESGRDIGIPTPVSCEYHPVSYSEGMAV